MCECVLSFRYNDDVGTTNNQSIKFWIVNDNLFITPISDILKDIRLFVAVSDEIVIIDFHKFPIGEQ